MKSMISAVGPILLLIAVPLQPQTLTDAQKAEIEKTLISNHKELIASVNRLDTAGYAKFLSDSFQERVGAGNVAARAKDTFLKWIGNAWSQRASQTVTPFDIRAFVLSPDSAYTLYVGGLQVTGKNGRQGGYGNAVTYIWRKELGGWKVVHIHESTW